MKKKKLKQGQTPEEYHMEKYPWWDGDFTLFLIGLNKDSPHFEKNVLEFMGKERGEKILGLIKKKKKV